MQNKNHSLRTRLTALLLALVCVLGLFPTTAFAASDTITLKEFGHSGVGYESTALGRCTLHEMTFKNGNKDTVGFCGTKGGGMGDSLRGQTWDNKRSISDPTVETMIIPREIFYRVKEEMTRRASKRKVMQKTGKTEQGKYSAKYALSELLVCGECGTPYKRCI